MGKPYIMVESMTAAIAGQKYLSGKGIDSAVKKTPSAAAKNGCGYSIVVSEGDVLKAKQLLSNIDIKIVGITRGNRGR